MENATYVYGIRSSHENYLTQESNIDHTHTLCISYGKIFVFLWVGGLSLVKTLYTKSDKRFPFTV